MKASARDKVNVVRMYAVCKLSTTGIRNTNTTLLSGDRE